MTRSSANNSTFTKVHCIWSIYFIALATSIFKAPLASCLSTEGNVNRRKAVEGILKNGISTTLAFTTASRPSHATPTLEGYEPNKAVTAESAGRFYFPALTPPFKNRATYRYDLGRDAWAFEQLLTFANVTATVRTVVIKMQLTGGLWVNGPQWPTGEFCKLLDELGEVEHVVLPCNALEHKAPMQAFTRRYPRATVWITPGQYSVFGACAFDTASCRMGYRVDGVLPVGDPASQPRLPPWYPEFDFRTLYVSLPQNAGPVSEAAFFHKPSNTLIATDSVVFVPDSAPPIFSTYFDTATLHDPDFWPKTVLQAVFLPLRQQQTADNSGQWPGYDAIRGRLIRAPILRAFADARAPAEVQSWVQSVSEMGRFDRILTSHFASPISATPQEYAAAFRYLDAASSSSGDPPIACKDWDLLDSLNQFIGKNKLGAPVVYDFKTGCLP